MVEILAKICKNQLLEATICARKSVWALKVDEMAYDFSNSCSSSSHFNLTSELSWTKKA
jgi:hypothetical protein